MPARKLSRTSTSHSLESVEHRFAVRLGQAELGEVEVVVGELVGRRSQPLPTARRRGSTTHRGARHSACASLSSHVVAFVLGRARRSRASTYGLLLLRDVIPVVVIATGAQRQCDRPDRRAPPWSPCRPSLPAAATYPDAYPRSRCVSWRVSSGAAAGCARRRGDPADDRQGARGRVQRPRQPRRRRRRAGRRPLRRQRRARHRGAVAWAPRTARSSSATAAPCAAIDENIATLGLARPQPGASSATASPPPRGSTPTSCSPTRRTTSTTGRGCSRAVRADLVVAEAAARGRRAGRTGSRAGSSATAGRG